MHIYIYALSVQRVNGEHIIIQVWYLIIHRTWLVASSYLYLVAGFTHPCTVYRPYSHKLLTINNYANCPSNFAFARSIYLFHPPIFEKILLRIWSIYNYSSSRSTCRVYSCSPVVTKVTPVRALLSSEYPAVTGGKLQITTV